MKNNKAGHIPLFHIVKRGDLVSWKAWLIRLAAGVTALLVCGIMTVILTDASFGEFFQLLFNGAFGTERRIWRLFQNTAMLLIVALAVTPAFKMKFWNIGAEGQVLFASLICALCMFYLGGELSSPVLILVMFVTSIAAGAVFAAIPAVFKAKWGTNETLFTLMMNYIAVCLTKYCINVMAPSGSGTVGIIAYGNLPKIGEYAYLLNIIIVAVLTVLLGIYLRFSKHGYEISVVGESINTAKYIGINVKKVIIRTMLLSGAICGVAGFLLVSGTNHTISETIVDGRGFTAILVSWLAQFNPITMVVVSFLVVFLDQGAGQIATMNRLGGSYADIITGIFFFFIIGCEFFINYKIMFRSFKKEPKKLEEVTE